jgi:PAS domain S-box-containing protein
MVDFNSDPELRERVRALEHAIAADRRDTERLTTALAQAGVGHFEWDLEHQTIYVSPLLQTMLGHGPQESMPSDLSEWLRYVRENDRYRVQKEIRDALAYGHTQFEQAYAIRRRDGSERRFLFRATITRTPRVEGAEATRVLGIAIDLPEPVGN